MNVLLRDRDWPVSHRRRHRRDAPTWGIRGAYLVRRLHRAYTLHDGTDTTPDHAMRYFGDVLVIALGLTLTAQAAAQTTFTVTGVCCSSYTIDGQQDPTLTVVRGQTYSFTLVNCAIHPFHIQSTSGIGGTAYPNVQNNGGTSGTVTLTVPINETATTLFYQCGNHDAMNGLINVVDPTTGGTPTVTLPPTQTSTPTKTRTSTPTSTAPSPPTRTPTPTPTSSATQTAAATLTRTATATVTPSNSPTATSTPGRTPTPTLTVTATPTSTSTATPLTIPTRTPTATPTPTFTSTPSVTPTDTASPTPTPSGAPTLSPSPTSTSTPPGTTTPTPIPCVGDCDSSGQVTVDEILSMVHVALGNPNISTCLAGDANHDNQITVDEILTAVGTALNGC